MSVDFGSLVKEQAAAGPAKRHEQASNPAASCARHGFLFGVCSVLGFFIIPVMGLAIGSIGFALCLLSVILNAISKKDT